MVQTAKTLRPHMNFWQANAEEMQYQNTYDIMITNAVTYYFTDVLKTFKLIFNALKPGGIYAIQAQTVVTPQFTTALNELLKYEDSALYFKTFRKLIHNLSMEELTQLLSQAGFVLDKTQMISHVEEFETLKALEIFKSGTATPFLDPNAYGLKPTPEYKTRFYEVVENSLYAQSHNGKIELETPRAYIIARKA